MPALSNILWSPVLVEPGAHDPYTRRELRGLALEPLFAPEHRHVWLGRFPPFDCLALDLARSTGYRASALLHGRFDVVWCCAAEAFGETDWPVVLDEALRLLGRRGFLVLRFPGDFSRMLRVKSFLARKHGWSLRIVDELNTANGLFAILEAERAEAAAPAGDAWTIGMLTSGKRDAVVEAMLRSVRAGQGGERHEILLFGPRNDDFTRYDVRYLDERAHGIQPHLNEISRKKNAIAAEAAHANLLICHDRYYLRPGFFESFRQFGLDWDYATANQVFADGQPFPALGAVGGMAIDRLDHLSDVSRFVDDGYVNGGFMLVKRALLRAIPLNAMCFWNQGEDAEYAAVLRQHGVIPRYNALATAVTDGVGKKHCASFRDAGDGTPVLLRYFRGVVSTGLRFHWRHGDYRVAEGTAALPDDEVLSLVVDPVAPGASVLLVLDVRPAEGEPVEYRVAGGGWQRIAPAADGGAVRLSVRQCAAAGRIAVEFRSGRAVAAARGAAAAARRADIVAELSVVDIRHVRAPQLDFARGCFGREGDGPHVWQWLSPDARLVLLNPNPFPMLARLSFGFHHAVVGGATRLTVPGGGGVDLIDDPAAPGRCAMTLLLEPGATALDLVSTGAALDAPPPGDGRLLSLKLLDWRLDVAEEDEVSAEGWTLLDRWFPGHPDADAPPADRSDAAVLVQTGEASRNEPLFLTLEGRFREHRRAGERLDLLLDGRHLFERVEAVDGRVCLRIDPALRGLSSTLLVTAVDANIRVDRVRLGRIEPADAAVATVRSDRRLAPGDTVRLGTETGAAGGGTAVLGEGWWSPEPEFCWTRARRATMELPVAWPPEQGATLVFEVAALCAPDEGFSPTVTVCVNGEAAGEWQPQNREWDMVAVPVDARAMATGRLMIELRQSAVSSPHALWGLADDRPLGMRVAGVRLA